MYSRGERHTGFIVWEKRRESMVFEDDRYETWKELFRLDGILNRQDK